MSYECPAVQQSGWLENCDPAEIRFPWAPSLRLRGHLSLQGSPIDQNELSKLLRLITLCIQLVKAQNIGPGAPTSLLLRIQFRPVEKRWITSSPTIDCCACNTGWTQRHRDGSAEILVYRVQDWCKVLLHELVHAWRWDNAADAQVSNVPVGNCFEAIVEYAALRLHAHLVTRILGDSESWDNEKANSWSLAKWYWRVGPSAREETNASAYMLLKCGIFHDANTAHAFFRSQDASIFRNLVSRAWNATVTELGPRPRSAPIVPEIRDSIAYSHYQWHPTALPIELSSPIDVSSDIVSWTN